MKSSQSVRTTAASTQYMTSLYYVNAFKMISMNNRTILSKCLRPKNIANITLNNLKNVVNLQINKNKFPWWKANQILNLGGLKKNLIGIWLIFKWIGRKKLRKLKMNKRKNFLNSLRLCHKLIKIVEKLLKVLIGKEGIILKTFRNICKLCRKEIRLSWRRMKTFKSKI
jgi:hypothetical protein